MTQTRQIPIPEWKTYFDRLTRSFLGDESTETVTVELLSPRLGDQIEAQSVRLLGLRYDPESNALEVWMEDLEHLVLDPLDIWVIEEDGGFVSAMEIKRSDDQMEILYLHRSGPPARQHVRPTSPGQ